jgi:hypothetical protein
MRGGETTKEARGDADFVGHDTSSIASRASDTLPANRFEIPYGRSLLPRGEKAIKNDKKMEKEALPPTF